MKFFSLERLLVVSILAFLLPFCMPDPGQSQGVTSITIKPAQVIGPVNRYVFGQNMESGDNARIFSQDTMTLDLVRTGGGYWDPEKRQPRQDVATLCRRVGVSVLRYPGGCLAHNFDWRRTVGPDAKKNGWDFGLDEYLQLCHSLNAVPIITVSDYVLPADQMPENAASLVEYLNAPADAAHPWAMKRKLNDHPEPYGVKWFELGNESMHGNHRLLPPRKFTPEQYVAYANATMAAMKKVDPTIKVGIITVPGNAEQVDNEWNTTVVRGAGKKADFLVVHLYISPIKDRGPEGQPSSVTAAARLARYHTLLRQNGHDMPLAVTEFNGPYQERNTFPDALQAVDLLRVFLMPSSNVMEASYWEFLNGSFGMLQSNGSNIQQEPAYKLFELFHSHVQDTIIETSIKGTPGLTALATKSAEGNRISLILINQSAIDTPTNLILHGAVVKQVSGAEISAREPDEKPLQLSPQALSHLTVPANAELAIDLSL